MHPDWAKPDVQTARSELRQQFLRTLDVFIGKECKITMFDKSVVAARFSGSDLEFQNILVSDLQTPNGIVRSAILRDIDILHIDFDNDSSMSEASDLLSDKLS